MQVDFATLYISKMRDRTGTDIIEVYVQHMYKYATKAE